MNNDLYYMKIALKEAKKAQNKGEVPVGCVIVNPEGKVVSRGHNLMQTRSQAAAHAELIAISRLSKKLKSWRLEGTTLYSTLQPCLMCMGAIMNSRVSRLVYGADDPNTKGTNSIFELENIYPELKCLHITNNVLSAECSYILKDFFKTLRV